MRLATHVCHCLSLEKGIKYILGYVGTILSVFNLILLTFCLIYYHDIEKKLEDVLPKHDFIITLIISAFYLIVCPMLVLAINRVSVITYIYEQFNYNVLLFSSGKAYSFHHIWQQTPQYLLSPLSYYSLGCLSRKNLIACPLFII